MYVFGGQGKNLVVFDDIWAFNILEKTWEKCISRGARPTPRYRATMVAHEDRLILFGGLCQTHNFNDLYVYKIQEGQWINPEISSPWPPIMSGHTATVHGRQMVVFGGHQGKNNIYNDSNDVWVLDLDSFTWKLQETTLTKPSLRHLHFQFHLNDDKLLIVGGSGRGNPPIQDMWLLTMTSPLWTWQKIHIIDDPINGDVELSKINTACIVGQKMIIIGSKMNRNLGYIMGDGTVFAFICDLSHIYDTADPYAKWMEVRELSADAGVLPENLKATWFSSLVFGYWELIHFGGILMGFYYRSNELHFITPI
ncbi:uncharacterized protein DMENIID0001_082060 [Sergentomyia squamirostris]